jgi:hypothetical protein
MKSRNVMLSLLLVCCLMAWAMIQTKPPTAKEALDRSPRRLQFSATALCRLRCLGLAQSDAASVLSAGVILYHKSNRRASPCPVWVVQGTTTAGITCRLRLEQCATGMIVVGAERPGVDSLCPCNEAPPGKKMQGQLSKK